MKRLSNYRKSPVNIIRIRYGKERFIFNLYDEAKIDMEMLDSEIKGTPSKYGFLLLLHKKLLTQFEEAKIEKDRIWGTLYLASKGKIGSNNRPYNEDSCKAYADKHKNYIKAKFICIQIKQDADHIYSAIRTLEMKANLLQTLSSNKRKETF